MKKYLMTGIAALTLCAGFTSCSHDLDSYSPDEIKELEAKKIVNNYEKAFKAYVGGEIASNQTWGFGSYASARTRAEGDEDNQHFYADANEWAAKDGEKYLVPDPLSDGQKARVQYYYQMNHIDNPINKDYDQIDFFVQQVYKGGTDPMGSPKSAEQYIAADNIEYIVGSNHMDQLTAGSDNIHINNYNYGNYSHGSTYPNVLDNDPVVIQNYPNPTNGGYVKNDNEQHHHGDQISLMLDTKTNTFGYANSNSSIVRNLYWMRSAAEIDAYITQNKAAYDAWLLTKTGSDGKPIKDEIVNDFWGQLGRGFIGFDFEMMVDNELYAKNDDGTIKYLTYGDLPDASYTWDGESTYGGPRPAADVFVTDADGNKIPVLNSSTNMYAGTNGDIQQSDIITSHSCLSGTQWDNNYDNGDGTYGKDVPYYQSQNCLNTKVLFDKVDNGYCLVDGSKGCKWVKIGNTADGYYSDWIVTFMPALHYSNTTIIIEDDPDDYSIRVMAEDLSASEESDFDFNDVVLDFFGTENSNVLNVTLQAAGGTLPLRINRDDTKEVHKLFDVPVNYMVNTNWHGSNSATVAEANLPKFTITLTSAINSEDAFLAAVQAIKLEVEKTVSDGTSDAKEWIEMKAEQGKPAAKFAVPVGTQWADERESLKKKYGKFSTWATTAPHIQWWRSDLAGDEDDEE